MENSKLSKNEMEKVLGGVMSINDGGDGGGDMLALTTCATTCNNSAAISVTCKPKEDCKASTGYRVQCIHRDTGKVGDSASCPNPPAGQPTLMSDAGLITMMSSAILTQASVSMLAQANTAPQSTLTLLK